MYVWKGRQAKVQPTDHAAVGRLWGIAASSCWRKGVLQEHVAVSKGKATGSNGMVVRRWPRKVNKPHHQPPNHPITQPQTATKTSQNCRCD